MLKFWLVPDESGVAPEVVGIGSVAAGKELGGGTNLTIDDLQNDCGVPGVADDVDWSAWCRSKGCGICGLGTNLWKTGVDVVTDSGEFLEANGIVAFSAPSNVLCLSVVIRSSSDNSSCCWCLVLIFAVLLFCSLLEWLPFSCSPPLIMLYDDTNVVLLLCFSGTYCTGANYCLDKVHQFRMVNR